MLKPVFNSSVWSKRRSRSSPQSNVLEASPDMKRESEKEWYFGNADKERRGPFSFEEVCEGNFTRHSKIRLNVVKWNNRV